MPPKVLIVDDDSNIREILRLYLAHEDLSLEFACDGSEALNKFRQASPDLVILDIMLPQINGWEVCKIIRNQMDTPILMITAKDTTDDKITGLEIGADDYMVKPFDPKEVVARVKALLRRASKPDGAGGKKGDLIRLGDLEVDIDRYVVCFKNRKIDFKPKEIQLLYFLLKNPNRVFSRDQLLENVWGYDYIGETRTVDVHIKRLREKLDAGDQAWKISTVWGVGYKLEVD